ncbi:MAG TPA: tRNA-dihydrouridine synthase family protein [Desulfobacterales bacterium]|nr:tRNA-dihydrouridine synthase family protein [Desulfobacterales bacterium]
MLPELAALLNRPLSIGSRTISNRLVFAPMTFLGHVAFRELLDRFGGCGLLFSEMCSARTVPTEKPSVSKHFRWRPPELPRLVCQIMGAEPAEMAAAAERIAAEGFFGVDLNFGCAAVTICKRGCGAALLRDPDLAVRIVERVRRAVAVPLTVKFRTGWKDDPDAAVRMARGFEAAGADAVTYHPRVAPDRRARPARWEYIGLVKQALRIPVFGNGNVFDPEGCLRMLRRTGCDGVSLGRIAVARPWVFAEWCGGFRPSPDTHRETVYALLDITAAHFDDKAAALRMRKFIFYFAANFRFGHSLFRRVQAAVRLAEIRAALDAFFAAPPELSDPPNLAFLQ